jgi:hypothetical protein
MHCANSNILAVRSLEDEEPPSDADVAAAVVGLDAPDLDELGEPDVDELGEPDVDELGDPDVDVLGGPEPAWRDPPLHAVNAKASTTRTDTSGTARHPRRQALERRWVIGSVSSVFKSLPFVPGCWCRGDRHLPLSPRSDIVRESRP